MSSRKAKSKSGRSSEDEGKTIEEHLTSDPYVTIWNPSSVCTAADHARKKNCGKNPWCLYGLGERDGIWKNNTQIIGALGNDVSLNLRAVDPADPKGQRLLPPTGLRNLGATCYLNVLIQSLFHNILVQDAVLNMQVTESTPGKSSGNSSDDAMVMREVIAELQRAFTHMKASRYGTFDLSRFVGLLQLDKSTQQDPQEFNKLFLSKIESCKFQPRDKQRILFGDLLRGRMKYSTTCLGCKQVRSPPEHDFHELDLSIEGAHSVEEALGQYLGIEELCNENQYDCGSCGGRRNAQRAVVICSTPSMLCLHLLRYGYDRKTFERKKLTNEVTFPDVLQVCGEQYRLTSVLYHKGRSAYGGHYVCDALDWETSQWWHFDDDVVNRTVNPALAMVKGGHEEKVPGQSSKGDPDTKKRSSPKVVDLAGNDGDGGDDALEDSDYEPIRTQGAGSAGGRSSGSKRKRLEPTVGGLVDLATTGSAASRKKGSVAPSSKGGQAGHAVEVDLTSTDAAPSAGAGTAGTSAGDAAVGKATVNRKRDAYMLTYVKVADFEASLRDERSAPSEELIADAQASSEVFQQKVRAYEQAKALVLAEAEERKKLYTAIREYLPPDCQITSLPGQLHVAHHKDFHLVPADWLHKWIKGDPSTFKSITAIKKDQISSAFTDTGIGSDVVILDTPAAVGGDSELIPVQCYLCPHGSGLDVAHQEKFKVLSDVAYEALFKSEHAWQQMDAELTHENYRCQRCADSIVDHRLAAHTQAGENTRILGLIEATTDADSRHSTAGNSRKQRPSSRSDPAGDSERQPEDRESPSEPEDPHAPAYWLYKAWLTQFKKLTATLEKAESSKTKSAAPLAPMFAQFITTQASEDISPVAMDKDVEIVTPPSPALDPMINAALFCEHGLPALNYTKKAVRVSAAAWEAIRAQYPQARAIELTEICCVQCEHDVRTQTEQLMSNKEQRSLEIVRPPLAALWKAKRIYPPALDACAEDDEVMVALPSALYAVDGRWVAHWRKYVQDPNFPAPTPLTNAKLRCQHGKSFLPLTLGSLAQGVRLQDHELSSLLVYKFQEEDLGLSEEETRYGGAAALARTASLPIAELITEAQWRNLLEFHGPSPDDQEIPAAMAKVPARELEEGEVLSSSEEAALTEAIGHELDPTQLPAVFSCRLVECSIKHDAGENSRWRWEPEVCGACLAEHESLQEAAQTAYINASVQVCFLRDAEEYVAVFGKSLPNGHNAGNGKAATAAASQGSGVPTRTSKRTRGRRSTSTIIADSIDSLAIVRLKVFEAFSRLDLPPNKQLLYDRRGEALSSHTMTLAECGVRSTDTIYVMECAAGAEDWGLADCFSAPTSHSFERGFTGTLLTRSEGGGSANSNAGSTSEADEVADPMKTAPPQKRRRDEEPIRETPVAHTDSTVQGKRRSGRPSQPRSYTSTDDADLDRALRLSVESAKLEGLRGSTGSYGADPEAEVYSLLEDSQASAPLQTPVKVQEASAPNVIVPLSEDVLQSLTGGDNDNGSSGGSSDSAYAGSHSQPIDIQDSPP